MLSHVWSSAVIGVDALPIEIETNAVSAITRYTVVGLPNGAVRESLDRVMAALRNEDLRFPRGRVTINLAPADVRKEGSAYDLPIAVGMTAATGHQFCEEMLEEFFLVGELALDGALRPVRGILPMAIQARHEGMQGIIVPAENAAEAGVVEGLDVYGFEQLGEVVRFLEGELERVPFETDLKRLFEEARTYPIDFSDVRGQENVKRSLEVAAAGAHNLVMVGPPGAGKTMLARRLPTILPPLTPDEALETTKIHSVGGHLDTRHGLVARRPFRSPHHTISDVGLCGGGSNPMPGEISLAHNGVLFLDELPEFRRHVLEVMRQPLEAGRITISRARCTVDYPARFTLVASMNPCPCGYLNDPQRDCVCSPGQVQRYLSKVSGPLMDRIDLHVEVTPVSYEQLRDKTPGESSSCVRERVIAALDRQNERFEDHRGIHANAQMSTKLVARYCRLDTDGNQLLKMAIKRFGLSARAYNRILKVSRTIADLAGAPDITAEHISEAVQYRTLDRDWWTG
jgi:magnesium chelatase family protein